MRMAAAGYAESEAPKRSPQKGRPTDGDDDEAILRELVSLYLLSRDFN